MSDLIKVIGPKYDPPQAVQEKVLSLVQVMKEWAFCIDIALLYFYLNSLMKYEYNQFCLCIRLGQMHLEEHQS